MMPPIMASISKKSSNKLPIIIFRCYIMGDKPIMIEQFFYGFGYGKSKYYGFRLWE